MRSSSSILYFRDCDSGIVSKKLLPYKRSSRFSPVIFCEFYNFAFYFSVCVPFWIIFLWKAKVCAEIQFFLHVDGSFFNTICWKLCLFPFVLLLLLCERSVAYIYVGLFLCSLFCSWLICLSLVPQCLDYWSLTECWC